MKEKLEIFIDGACRGNPGPAAVGVVIYQNGVILKKLSKCIGHATNNLAEYSALIYALQEALLLKAEEIQIHTDSQLMFNQLKGDYKINSPQLKELFTQVKELAGGFKKISFKQIPREKNQEADKLAGEVLNQALKNEQAKVIAPTFNFTT